MELVSVLLLYRPGKNKREEKVMKKYKNRITGEEER